MGRGVQALTGVGGSVFLLDWFFVSFWAVMGPNGSSRTVLGFFVLFCFISVAHRAEERKESVSEDAHSQAGPHIQGRESTSPSLSTQT